MKVQTTTSLSAESVSTWKKADGSFCYSILSTVRGDLMDPEGFDYEWRNADDETVATGRYDVDTEILTIECDGKSYEIDPEACAEEEPANGTPPDQSTCSLGTCSY